MLPTDSVYRGPEDSAQFVLSNLDPDRIRLQRERKGWTGKKLASKIKKTPSAVSQIERGIISPDLETLIRLGLALQVPVKFFLKRSTNTSIALDKCHFRAKRGVPQYLRRQAIADVGLLMQVVSLLEKRGIEFPIQRFSGFSDCVEIVDPKTPADRMEELAVRLREHWGMGPGPIPNLIALLESKGAIVLPMPSIYDDVDAFSVWESEKPVILLSQSKASSRDRFDAAHELCHLLLHEDIEPGDRDIEDQANRFAGAFLAPRESFLPECPRRWSMAAFLQLKPRWKISVSALVRRAYDLECISESAYKSANIELRGRLKEAGEEPGEWQPERPTMLEQAFSLLKDEVDLDQLAHEVGVHPPDLRNLLSRCVSETILNELDRSSAEGADSEKIVHLIPSE